MKSGRAVRLARGRLQRAVERAQLLRRLHVVAEQHDAPHVEVAHAAHDDAVVGGGAAVKAEQQHLPDLEVERGVVRRGQAGRDHAALHGRNRLLAVAAGQGAGRDGRDGQGDNGKIHGGTARDERASRHLGSLPQKGAARKIGLRHK